MQETSDTTERLAGCGLDAAPLGPGSLTWKYFGDRRNVLVAGRAGVLQAMHPTIAAGLLDHSDVFDNPFDRLNRSAGPILGVVYDPDPAVTGQWVRDQHPEIRGVDGHGRAYHALSPDAYYCAHATFFESQIAAQAMFGSPLGRAEKEQLYRESITWYARYGVSMRPVPEDYAAFERYWQRMFRERLEPTRVARGSIYRVRGLPAPSGLPDFVWRPLGPVVGAAVPWLTRVTLPEEARLLFGIQRGDRDERAFRVLRRLVRTFWPAVPTRARMLQRVRTQL